MVVSKNSKQARPIPPHHPEATIVRRSSAEQAAAYIRDLIFAGYLAPGERIPQDAIARSLGISRIPIREALVALEQEGRIRTEMHRGAFVVPLDERSIRDASELVSLMQGFVARRAAERMTAGQKAQLTEIQRQIDDATDPIELRRHMEEHQLLLMAAAVPPRIAQWIRGMTDLTMDNFFEVVPGSVDSFKDHSRAITHAVLDGDLDLAEKLGGDNGGVENVVSYYRARNLFGDAGSDGDGDGSATGRA